MNTKVAIGFVSMFVVGLLFGAVLIMLQEDVPANTTNNTTIEKVQKTVTVVKQPTTSSEKPRRQICDACYGTGYWTYEKDIYDENGTTIGHTMVTEPCIWCRGDGYYDEEDVPE